MHGALLRVATLIAALALLSCARKEEEVVVYVAHDRALSEPILRRFEADTGVRVRALYDVEANKTLGLANRLIAESAAPRADVFWNNEVIQTIRLQSRGVVGGKPIVASGVTPALADLKARWIGFAARARVLLVNTTLVDAGSAATLQSLGVWDLTRDEWRGRVAVANPRFGTTGTHFSALLSAWGEPRFREWLRALRANDVVVLPGNAQVRDHVARGRAALGLTDTDDAVGAVEEGAPVKIVFPDQGELGALLVPNTVALVARAPHEDAALRLAGYLLSAQVEQALAQGRGAQFPINHDVPPPKHLPARREIRAMAVDFEAVASNYERMLAIVEEEW